MKLSREDPGEITARTLGHYDRHAGLPRERQPWLASVWRKTASGS